jgi:hypothetical protein
MPTKRQFILDGLYITERQGEWLRDCRNWEKKIVRLDDEKLVYIREMINYELEKRSQEYMAECCKVTNKNNKEDKCF